MPIYRRGYRRRFRRYRRYGRRYRRRYARRYVNGSSRSSIRCKCVVTGQSTLHSGYGDTLGTDVFRISPFATSGLSNPVPVVSSPLFQAYQNLYEEMKIIGMKVQISVTDQVGGATLPSLQIYTAWDRRVGYGEAALTPSMIKNASSNNIATALNNNIAKLSRSIYASDLIEKAQWLDSSFADVAGSNIAAWEAAGLNPNFFHPGFYMCFGSPSLSQASEVASVHFSVSVTYYIAFRNPRFGGSSSNRELAAKTVTFVDPDDGSDMEEEIVSPRDEPQVNSLAARLAGYVPAGAAQAAAAMADAEPVPLERRQRSAASQEAGDRPARKKRQKNPK